MDRSVTQKHHMSCGIACVAFVAGVDYEELTAGCSEDKLEEVGFYCPELVRLLKRYGLTYRWRKVSADFDAASLQVGDIVFLERSKLFCGGHFLARAHERWMDPWINWPEVTDIRFAKSGFSAKLTGIIEYVVYQ